jgi:hypothetical protein
MAFFCLLQKQLYGHPKWLSNTRHVELSHFWHQSYEEHRKFFRIAVMHGRMLRRKMKGPEVYEARFQDKTLLIYKDAAKM